MTHAEVAVQVAHSGVYRFSQREGPYLLKNFWCEGGLVAGVVLGANCVWFAPIHLIKPH